ncbi:MAG TPA: DUF1152 domain-containing protein [Kofleriaceae bacterium]|jgi:hypothetical protein|nr:DUF1152 domain-containing protein [Kofleriaceae bacterium]
MIEPRDDELPLPGERRILVLGAGGGSDVIAAEVVRRALLRRAPGRQVDLAGLLNPKFEHHYLADGDAAPERAINRAAGVARFRRASLDEPPRSYAQRVRDGRCKPMPDARLAELVDGPIYQLSTRFGLDELCEFAAGYEAVLACDVGGDILYGGPADNMVRTPLMDAFSLALLRRIHARGTTGYVLLLGPGTDGELSPERLAAAIDALGRRGAIRARGRLSARDVEALADLQERCGEASGKTLRLIVAVRAALASGASLPAIAGRDMERFRLWVDQAYLLDGAGVWSHNPLAAGDSREQIAAIASDLGWFAPDPPLPEPT